jgi:hypothetical protein
MRIHKVYREGVNEAMHDGVRDVDWPGALL